MQKVISINLNGNAYQLDEAGYEALRQYLTRAEQQLAANPDRAEIIADLEQAIADKCQKYLGPHKNVVTSSEIDQIVTEMGPVDGAAGEKSGASGPAATGTQADRAAETPPRRLYRIPAGAMIAGVCTGLAAYFKIDVTLVRVGFVIATLVTKGAATIAYIVMMFVVPEASTAEEHAAAGGLPFNAREVIERAKTRTTEAGREWRRQWRRQQRAWRRHAWPAGVPVAFAPSPASLVLIPVFGLVHMALFLAMIAMMISLVNTGGIFGWALPPDVPVWAGALILLVAYQIVVSPFRMVRYWASSPGGAVDAGPYAFWNAVVWLVGLSFAIWLASDHIPEIREFLQRLPELFRDFLDAMRDLFQRVRAR